MMRTTTAMTSAMTAIVRVVTATSSFVDEPSDRSRYRFVG